jgi:hypothetical protein
MIFSSPFSFIRAPMFSPYLTLTSYLKRENGFIPKRTNLPYFMASPTFLSAAFFHRVCSKASPSTMPHSHCFLIFSGAFLLPGSTHLFHFSLLVSVFYPLNWVFSTDKNASCNLHHLKTHSTCAQALSSTFT